MGTLEDGGLSTEEEFLKGPEQEFPPTEPVLPADVKKRFFHFLLQLLRFWSFLLSNSSWQSCFLQFPLERRAHSSVTFGSKISRSCCYCNETTY